MFNKDILNKFDAIISSEYHEETTDFDSNAIINEIESALETEGFNVMDIQETESDSTFSGTSDEELDELLMKDAIESTDAGRQGLIKVSNCRVNSKRWSLKIRFNKN